MDDNFNEKLNLDELYFKKKTTYDSTINTYKKILARVHKKIKTTARMRNNDNFCFFLLPEFILGIPKYDIATCITYVIDKLIDNGFNVRYTHPNLLFISWKNYIPYHTRMDIKKKHGIKVDGFGNVIKKKEKEKDSSDINNLMFKTKNNIALENKNKKIIKDFNSVSNYKPTGNLIYSDALLEKISDSIQKK